MPSSEQIETPPSCNSEDIDYEAYVPEDLVVPTWMNRDPVLKRSMAAYITYALAYNAALTPVGIFYEPVEKTSEKYGFSVNSLLNARKRLIEKGYLVELDLGRGRKGLVAACNVRWSE